MKKLFLFFLILPAFNKTIAQKKPGGEWSAGLRLGGSTGISLKSHAKSNDYAFEFLAANSFDEKMKGISLGILYEKLAPISDNGRLSAIAGGGFSFNFRDRTNFGVTGILGFDWRLKAAPINLQLDWAPTFFFINTSYFSGVNGAFSVRYILNKK